MTGHDLQVAFGTYLNEHYERLEVQSDDVFYWLTKAQSQLITEAFEELDGDRRVGNLLLPFMDRGKASAYFDEFSQQDTGYIPCDFRYVLSIEANIAHNRNRGISFAIKDTPNAEPENAEKKRVPSGQYTIDRTDCRIVQKGDKSSLQDDPFQRSYHRKINCVVEGDRVLFLQHDINNFVVTKFFFEYIRNPEDVDRESGTELPEAYHHTLVERAVRLFVRNARANSTEDQPSS